MFSDAAGNALPAASENTRREFLVIKIIATTFGALSRGKKETFQVMWEAELQ